jgi:hypothetical protein
MFDSLGFTLVHSVSELNRATEYSVLLLGFALGLLGLTRFWLGFAGKTQWGSLLGFGRFPPYGIRGTKPSSKTEQLFGRKVKPSEFGKAGAWA